MGSQDRTHVRTCVDVSVRVCPTAGILSQGWAPRAMWGWEAAWVLRGKPGSGGTVGYADWQPAHQVLGEALRAGCG